jgi:hypothetical protein
MHCPPALPVPHCHCPSALANYQIGKCVYKNNSKISEHGEGLPYQCHKRSSRKIKILENSRQKSKIKKIKIEKN